MKLTKENYELLMFDLLEGNLPEDVALDLEAQINNDEFYSKEWSLFKSTVLVPDSDIVFSNKEELLHSETKVIPLRTWLTISVAASIIIALFLFVPNKTAESPIVEIPEINTKAPDTDLAPEDKEQIIPETINQNKLVNRASKSNYSKPNGAPNTDPEKTEYPNEINEPEFVENELIEDLFEDPIDFKPLDEIMSDTNTNPIDNIAKSNPIDDFLDQDVTKNPIERISSKLSYTIAKLSKPKMKFQPNWKEKNLKIELETTGYHAIASVDPFKKK